MEQNFSMYGAAVHGLASSLRRGVLSLLFALHLWSALNARKGIFLRLI